VALSYALSISHFVSSVGADAGFAALLGLAILVLLYFAHAREAATLRKQLAAATQRLEELERRVAQEPSVPVAPRPPVSAAPGAVQAATPARRGVASTEQVGGPTTVAAGAGPGPRVASRPASVPPVAAPAGVAAPALTDATRVVSSSGELAPDRQAPPTDGRSEAAFGPSGVGKAPSAVTAAGGDNGSPAQSEPLAARSLLEQGLPGRTRGTRWLVSLLAVVVAAAIAAALVVVLSGGGSHHPAAPRQHIAAAPSGVVPGAVTVAVVNATSVNQLAHHIGDRLTSRGFKEGTLATASNQSLAATTVGYLPGHRSDALAVAHALRLPASAVIPASSSNKALVCPAGATCAADVIVVAGSDLAPRR